MSEPHDEKLKWSSEGYMYSKDNIFIDTKSMKIVSAYELNL